MRMRSVSGVYSSAGAAGTTQAACLSASARSPVGILASAGLLESPQGRSGRAPVWCLQPAGSAQQSVPARHQASHLAWVSQGDQGDLGAGPTDSGGAMWRPIPKTHYFKKIMILMHELQIRKPIMKTVCSREDDPLASACLQGVLQNVYHSAYGMGERERGAESEAGTPSPVLDITFSKN